MKFCLHFQFLFEFFPRTRKLEKSIRVWLVKWLSSSCKKVVNRRSGKQILIFVVSFTPLQPHPLSFVPNTSTACRKIVYQHPNTTSAHVPLSLDIKCNSQIFSSPTPISYKKPNVERFTVIFLTAPAHPIFRAKQLFEWTHKICHPLLANSTFTRPSKRESSGTPGRSKITKFKKKRQEKGFFVNRAILQRPKTKYPNGRGVEPRPRKLFDTA